MDCREEKNGAPPTERIREINDRLRICGEGGRVILTRAVSQLGYERVNAILVAIKSAFDFNPGNDPWGEHDFGEVENGGDSFFWKIECYDLNLQLASTDPSDEAITLRIMSVMTAPDL